MLIGGLILATLQFTDNKFRSVLLFGVLIFGYIIPLVVSWVVTPILHERYPMIYFPTLVLLVSIGWTETRVLNWTQRTLILAGAWIAIAVNFSFIHPYFRQETKEPWKAMAEELKNAEKLRSLVK